MFYLCIIMRLVTCIKRICYVMLWSCSLWGSVSAVRPPHSYRRIIVKWSRGFSCVIVIGFNQAARPVQYYCVTVHRRLYGDAPSYLVENITPAAAPSARASVRSAETRPSQFHARNRSFAADACVRGTSCSHRFVQFNLPTPLDASWNHYLFI